MEKLSHLWGSIFVYIATVVQHRHSVTQSRRHERQQKNTHEIAIQFCTIPTEQYHMKFNKMQFVTIFAELFFLSF